MPNDFLEENALKKSELDHEALSAYEVLGDVIAKYQDRRGENIEVKSVLK